MRDYAQRSTTLSTTLTPNSTHIHLIAGVQSIWHIYKKLYDVLRRRLRKKVDLNVVKRHRAEGQRGTFRGDFITRYNMIVTCIVCDKLINLNSCVETGIRIPAVHQYGRFGPLSAGISPKTTFNTSPRKLGKYNKDENRTQSNRVACNTFQWLDLIVV